MFFFTTTLLKKSFLELVISGNTRLHYVKEEDKGSYIRDFLESVKKGKMIKELIDEQTGGKMFEVNVNMITGVISKGFWMIFWADLLPTENMHIMSI